MFQSLSDRLQVSIRFLCDPIPTPPSVFLAVNLPRGAESWVLRVPLQ